MAKPNNGKCLDMMDPGTLELIKESFSKINIEMLLVLARQNICPTCALYLSVRTLVADVDDVAKSVTFEDAVQVVAAAVADHYDQEVIVRADG